MRNTGLLQSVRRTKEVTLETVSCCSGQRSISINSSLQTHTRILCWNLVGRTMCVWVAGWVSAVWSVSCSWSLPSISPIILHKAFLQDLYLPFQLCGRYLWTTLLHYRMCSCRAVKSGEPSILSSELLSLRDEGRTQRCGLNTLEGFHLGSGVAL